MEIECKECGAPAEAIASAIMNGVDTDGQEALFEVVRIWCAAGHFYDEIGSVTK